MTEYDRTNTFVLFVNDKKGNEKAPDRSGTVNVDGVEYFIDGWIRNGTKGPFLSGKIKRKDAARSTPQPTTRRQPEPNDIDSDIPF